LIRGSTILKSAVTIHTDNLIEDIVTVQAMLVGLAIECALKGKYVKDGGRLTDNDDILAVPRRMQKCPTTTLVRDRRLHLSRSCGTRTNARPRGWTSSFQT
jgi:hypothetical protein